MLIKGLPATITWGKTGLRHWSSLFLSQGCPVCDRPTGKQLGQIFCIDCQRQIPGLYPLSGEHRPSADAVQAWYRDDIHCLPISALGRYHGTLKRAILAMKYSNRPEVAHPLGKALGQQWLSQLSGTTSSAIPQRRCNQTTLYAVPIPLHTDRQTNRGFNQAELIAKAFCQASGISLLADGLARTQATLPQHQLSLSARQQNLEQAFQVGPSLHRKQHQASRSNTPTKKATNSPSVLLIDDIYTTGTTARSAAQALSREGIPVIGMLAIARAIL